MRGMILAAGRGERMGVLTEVTPKPLLKLSGKYLIEYSINAMAKAGIKEIVVNVSYLHERIKEALGNGSRYGVSLYYSVEPQALETGGGIFQALPILGKEPFIVLSSDVISDFSLKNLPSMPEKLAHLIMVDNPAFHPGGDFVLKENELQLEGYPKLTFANIGIYKPELFAGCKPGRFRLGEILKTAISNQQVTGEYFSGNWHNVGTPEDLAKAALSF